MSIHEDSPAACCAASLSAARVRRAVAATARREQRDEYRRGERADGGPRRRRSPTTRATTSCRGSTGRWSPTGRPRSRKRERAIDGYLNDTDPGRAEKYGFRSGQNPRLAWSWFRDNPVGFNGVPFVLFKTILDLDPNHENPTLRAHRPHLEARGDRAGGIRDRPRRAGRSITSASGRTRPTTSTAWRARPASASRRCRSDSRSRTRARSSRCRRPRRRCYDGAAAGAARVPEHQPADRQAARPPTRGELGDATGRASAARARWIACSSRARPATSAA